MQKFNNKKQNNFRHPHAGPAVHDRPDRGELDGPRAEPDRHLLGQLGPHRRRTNRRRSQERHHESHRAWSQ